MISTELSLHWTLSIASFIQPCKHCIHPAWTLSALPALYTSCVDTFKRNKVSASQDPVEVQSPAFKRYQSNTVNHSLKGCEPVLVTHCTVLKHGIPPFLCGQLYIFLSHVAVHVTRLPCLFSLNMSEHYSQDVTPFLSYLSG